MLVSQWLNTIQYLNISETAWTHPTHPTVGGYQSWLPVKDRRISQTTGGTCRSQSSEPPAPQCPVDLVGVRRSDRSHPPPWKLDGEVVPSKAGTLNPHQSNVMRGRREASAKEQKRVQLGRNATICIYTRLARIQAVFSGAQKQSNQTQHPSIIFKVASSNQSLANQQQITGFLASKKAWSLLVYLIIFTLLSNSLPPTCMATYMATLILQFCYASHLMTRRIEIRACPTLAPSGICWNAISACCHLGGG